MNAAPEGQRTIRDFIDSITATLRSATERSFTTLEKLEGPNPSSDLTKESEPQSVRELLNRIEYLANKVDENLRYINTSLGDDRPCVTPQVARDVAYGR